MDTKELREHMEWIRRTERYDVRTGPAVVDAVMALLDGLDGLNVQLDAYDRESDSWSAVMERANAERRAESYQEAVAHSEELEELAHQFAMKVRDLLS